MEKTIHLMEKANSHCLRARSTIFVYREGSSNLRTQPVNLPKNIFLHKKLALIYFFGNTKVCLFSSKGQINATRITAIAMSQEGSDVVEIRARVYPSQTKQFQCDVLVNGIFRYFNYTWEKTQYFKSIEFSRKNVFY